jgi:hypothetical protein
MMRVIFRAACARRSGPVITEPGGLTGATVYAIHARTTGAITERQYAPRIGPISLAPLSTVLGELSSLSESEWK